MNEAATEKPETPSQAVRDQFAKAIDSNDTATATELLAKHPLLANADLRPAKQRDHFPTGLPLFRACQKNATELAVILLEHDANPDAPGSNPDDQPEFSMPLHFAALDHNNHDLANLLLDYGANPNGFPYCSQSTIEKTFYRAREDGPQLDWNAIVRKAFASYLPSGTAHSDETQFEHLEESTAESVRLFARMIDHGAQVPFVALVRTGFNDLLCEIVMHCPDANGTPHDHPNSTVLDNIFGASRWYGYPNLHRRILKSYPDRIQYSAHLDTILIAISSHNRDGDYQAYREIIVMHLERLKVKGELQRARNDPNFKPLLKMATDFIWHDNYGYRAEIAKPECYVDLADLFVDWGFSDINFVDPKTGHSPLSAAVMRGHHPGILAYIKWLLSNGADVRAEAPVELNPLKVAIEKGHQGIAQLLKQSST